MYTNYENLTLLQIETLLLMPGLLFNPLPNISISFLIYPKPKEKQEITSTVNAHTGQLRSHHENSDNPHRKAQLIAAIEISEIVLLLFKLFPAKNPTNNLVTKKKRTTATCHHHMNLLNPPLSISQAFSVHIA